MRTIRLGFILSMIALSCFLFACAEMGPAVKPTEPAKKTTIRIGSPFKTGHILVDAGEKFKELVEKGSGGRIAVEMQIGAKSEEEIDNLCSKGTIDMQSNGNHPIEIFASQYFFVGTPYIMKDWDHLKRVWQGNLGKKAREQIEKNGNLIHLGIVYRGLRQTTAKKPIYTPADAYGLKLRLPKIPMWIAVWKEIGAEPVPLTLPELYPGLKEGKADASEGDLTQISSFKLNEVQTHLIITNHMVQIGGMLINKPFFDKLSKADQDLVIKAAKEACDWASNKMIASEKGVLLELQRKGMQVVIPDADSFREKAKPAVEQLFKTTFPVTTWAEVLAQ